MNDLTPIVNTASRIILLLLSVLIFGWALFPDYRPVFSGLVLGVVAGGFNVRFLSSKVQELGMLAMNPEGKRYNFGFLTRLCISVLVVAVAARFDQVSLVSAVVGLMIPQLLTIPVSIVVSIRNNH
ncbi:ATP synthase subunit I [Saccharibacillus kuerlensis]|uniref:ATP synthase subunit I n=1 Tax=Saccharibacillus kuerlensis TaxID=459527 RepID=A0ABQ2KU76_9BACL|nr:ATP synthase subunit I [Saccharibacillus kuerlensis]GGN93359.1 hypothetical protein GCM10010969_06970 [Saccharibacillus kuerlensis]